MAPKVFSVPIVIPHIATLICTNREDRPWRLSSQSTDPKIQSNFPPTSSWSQHEKSVHRIPIRSRKKTIPVVMAIKIKMTTPMGKKSAMRTQLISYL